MYPQSHPCPTPRRRGGRGLAALALAAGLTLPTTLLIAQPAVAEVASERSGLAEAAEAAAQGQPKAQSDKRKAERKAERKAQRETSAIKPGYDGATPIKTGWWWLLNNPPQQAETGVVAIPAPPTPTVPAGSIPVGALLGEAEKVSAIEFVLDEPDRAVQSLVLSLQEATERQAVIAPAGAIILACQVTESFWADGPAARWNSRPAYDCEKGAAQGERDDEGRWTFDLTPLARSWTGSTPASASVVFVEAVDAPGGFQLAFQGLASETIGVKAVFGDSVLPPSEGEEPDEEVVDNASPPPSSGGSTGGSSSGDFGSTGGDSSSGDFGAPADGGDPVAGDAGGTGDGTVTDAPIATRAVALPSWYDGIPAGGLLLLPVALLLAALAMLALGPDGQPGPGRPQRGVSKALEVLRATRSTSS